MYVTILGRQPAISVAELERLYGADAVAWMSDQAALVSSDNFDFEILGGAQKAGRVTHELKGGWREARQTITTEYAVAWQHHEGKLTLGISAYGFDAPARDIQKTGIILKNALKKHGVSVRLVPNSDAALNTASSHHNKLGLSPNKIELLVVRGASGRIVIAESVGAQNITALAARDQARPKTDAFVGMLPPKLARMMVNMAGSPAQSPARLLDPFCGTGVVLQEAAILGYDVYGTDLSDKMVDYSKVNLEWISQKLHLPSRVTITQGDAMNASWQPPIDAVVCETYLGQPFSAPPSPAKLKEVQKNCNHIISSFLKNLHPQITKGTPVVLAIPAWRNQAGTFTHLPLASHIEELGFRRIHLTHIANNQLLYYRETQVVAREILILSRV